MSDDWNAKTIADFRANEGKVGGPFEGAPWSWCITAAAPAGAVRHPTMYLPHDTEQGVIYVFASRGEHPATPTGTTT
jgi:hypothetical protein